MASYEINAYGAVARRRNPAIVVVLTLVTIGIYNWIWYYRINRELRDFGRVYQLETLAKVRPWLSVLATTIGGVLIVPAIVSWWRTTSRIRRAQEVVGAPLTNGWIIFACYVGALLISITGLIIPGYVQQGLNEIWDRYPRVTENEDMAALEPPPAYEVTAASNPSFGEPGRADPRLRPDE